MHITIYFNEKPVYLCNKITEEMEEKRKHFAVIFSDDLSADAISSFIAAMKKPSTQAGILFHQDFDNLKKAFFGKFEFIEAAGGIVQNENKDLLFIFRKGKWDLPKGKMDAGENAETCARREIAEETGVKGLNFRYKVGDTYHVYEERGKQILKESHWFSYTTTYSGNLIPQLDEDITEVTWTPTRNIRQPMANSYATIRDIMHTFFDKP